MIYKLIYADRKTVSMRFADDGTLLVRAPRYLPTAEIEKIIKMNSSRLEKMKAETLANEKRRTEADLDELEKRLRAIALPLVEKYSRKMGVSPQKVKFTNAKTNFGSCNTKRTVCFSRYLALYPERAIEYVVVHELAHLFELNHSPRFYAILEKYLPDWKERKKLLTL